MRSKVACLSLFVMLLLAPYSSFAFLEDEAGISAYGYLSGVNIDLAENAYKVVEEKTSDYIIGSVALNDYGESDDVHVYLNTSGWIIAYYLKEEKASKIIDWKDYTGGTITSTKLEDALTKVCAEMYLMLPDITYWDFRYPDASDIMIVTDEILTGGTETFTVMVPSSGHFMYDRTWSHALNHVAYYGGSSNINVDTDLLHTGSFGHGSPYGWRIWEGDITPLQLFPDITHDFSITHSTGDIYAYIGVVLIYKQTN